MTFDPIFKLTNIFCETFYKDIYYILDDTSRHKHTFNKLEISCSLDYWGIQGGYFQCFNKNPLYVIYVIYRFLIICICRNLYCIEAEINLRLISQLYSVK